MKGRGSKGASPFEKANLICSSVLIASEGRGKRFSHVLQKPWRRILPGGVIGCKLGRYHLQEVRHIDSPLLLANIAHLCGKEDMVAPLAGKVKANRPTDRPTKHVQPVRF